jgi:hypothetical protein
MSATRSSGAVIGVGSPRNPFSSGFHGGALDYLFAPPQSAAALLQRLGEAGGQGQILGAEGSGKTTLLCTLARHARASGRAVLELRCDRSEHVRALDQAFAGAEGVPRLICLDEADALRPAARRRLRRTAAERGVELLLASHHDLRLPTLWRCQIDEALARTVADEVLRRSPQALPLVDADEVGEALRRRGGNLREALRLMYDWYEQRWAERR